MTEETKKSKAAPNDKNKEFKCGPVGKVLDGSFRKIRAQGSVCVVLKSSNCYKFNPVPQICRFKAAATEIPDEIRPGPIYKLPPVVGYPGHDITKLRYPAFSIARKFPLKGKGGSVGSPMYDPGRCNRFGKFHSPAFSLLQRIPLKPKGVGPGPAAYNTQNMKDFGRPTPPSASIKSRRPVRDLTFGPGPGAYNPSNPRPKAISMKFRHPESHSSVGPGPGAYMPNLMGKRPQYAKILGRPTEPKSTIGPGPAYFPNFSGSKVPAFSFGVKHSDCVGTYTRAEVESDTEC